MMQAVDGLYSNASAPANLPFDGTHAGRGGPTPRDKGKARSASQPLAVEPQMQPQGGGQPGPPRFAPAESQPHQFTPWLLPGASGTLPIPAALLWRTAPCRPTRYASVRVCQAEFRRENSKGGSRWYRSRVVVGIEILGRFNVKAELILPRSLRNSRLGRQPGILVLVVLGAFRNSGIYRLEN